MKLEEFDKLFKENFEVLDEVDSGGGESGVSSTVYYLNKSVMFCALYRGDEMLMAVPAEMLIDLGKVYLKYSELDYERFKSGVNQKLTFSGWIKPYDIVSPYMAA